MDVAPVWLEGTDGKRWPIAAACSMGRSTSNDVVVDDQGVSRRHALIHKQDDAEYWIIDLGSGNGTFLNDRRLTLATRLKDGDVLRLGERSFSFRQIVSAARRTAGSFSAAPTIINIKSAPCWLLVADIIGSTALAARLTSTDMAMLAGKWMATCKEIVEAHGGTVNKYLGDGYLAFWPFEQGRPPRILGALERLTEMQRTSQGLKFRLALHQGEVTIGGSGSQGEDSLSGLDVIFVFRMEKLAAGLGCDFLVSETAKARLATVLRFDDLGVHVLPGFEATKHRFYKVL